MSRFNDGRHIHSILENTSCGRHHVGVGTPCFYILRASGEGFGVCGFRIKKAGYNGTISPSSLSLKVSGGRAESRAQRSSK